MSRTIESLEGAAASRHSENPVVRFLRTGLTGLGLLALAACDSGGGTTSETATAPTETGAPEKVVLHRGNSGEPSSLDAHRISGTWESSIGRDLYLGLMTDSADGTPIYGAAESHTVSDDGRTYTFTIREGHQWSDGTPVTADDFVFSYRRILDPATAAEYASIMYVLNNGAAVNAGDMPLEAVGARAVDDRTLVLELAYPAPFLLQLLTHQAAYPVPKHVVEALGDDWVDPTNMATNGAYSLGDWRPNDYVRLEKNPLFYDAENVSIDTVFYYPTDDRSSALRRFRAGELDMNSDFPLQQYDWLQKNLPGAARVAPYLITNCIFINTENAPFDNRDIRFAMGMAIDRTVLTRDIMRSGQVPAFAWVPAASANYPNTAQASFKDQPLEERIAAAQALMEKAGYGPDNRLKITFRYREGIDNKRVAIAIGAMWKQIYIDAELLNTEVKTHYADMRAGNFDVADGGWVADFNDPKNFLFLLDGNTGFLNYTNYANPAYDALLAQADQTADIEERGRLLSEAEQLMLDDMPLIPTFFGTSRNLVGAHVTGFVANADDKHATRYLGIDESLRRR